MSGWRWRGRFLAAFLLLAGAAAGCRTVQTGIPGRGDRHSVGFAELQALPAAPLQLAIPRVGHEVTRRVLPNGIVLYLLPDRSLPLVNATALIRTPLSADPPGREGTARLTASQMRAGGIQGMSADGLDDELEFLAATVEVGAGSDYVAASFSALSKDTARVLELFSGVLMRPAFDPQKLEVARGRLLEELRRENDNPVEILGREFRRAIYGPDHPLGRRPQAGDVARITREDLVAWHARFVVPNRMMLAVAGDFDPEVMAAEIARSLGGWSSRPVDVPAFPPVPPPGGRRVLLFPKALPQASVAIGHLGTDLHDPDRYAVELMNLILGGSGFTSRIPERVRSDEGLAYSVGTRFDTDTRYPGLFRAVLLTRTEAAPRAIAAVLDEIEKIRTTPVSDEELATARDALINSFVFRFTSASAVVSRLMRLEFDGMPRDEDETLLDRYRAVTKEDILRVARTHLHPEAFTILVVGDATRLAAPLAAFGPVTEIGRP